MIKKIIIICILLMVMSSACATIWFDDGGVHNIDYEINDEVQIWDDEFNDLPTTVNLLEGGDINGVCQVSLNSQLNIYGGTLNNGVVPVLSTYDYSQTKIFEGSINRGISVNDNSNIYILGGEYDQQIAFRDDSVGFISGGMISNHSSIYAYNASQITISGGTLGASIFSYGDSIIYYSGGVQTDHDRVILQARERGKIFIDGSHFRINGEYYGFGEINIFSGILTGKLENGDPIDIRFGIDPDASIFLIPEPASLILINVGCLFLRKNNKNNKNKMIKFHCSKCGKG